MNMHTEAPHKRSGRAHVLAVAGFIVAQSTLVVFAQAPTLPVRVDLSVSHSDRAEVPVGTACVLTVVGASGTFNNCRVRIECGASTPYGAERSGFNVCRFEHDGSLTVHDPNTDDGDPALSLQVRGGGVSANIWSDAWRVALAVPAVGGAAGHATSAAPPQGRQPDALDCAAQDQGGRVTVQCGSQRATCMSAARLDARRETEPSGARSFLEAHSCRVGERAVVAVVAVRGGSRQVLGVAPLSDGAPSAALQRVQAGDLVETAPLGPLPVDPDAQAAGRGRQVVVLTWLDARGRQWQSAIGAQSGAVRNLGTFPSCSGPAAASNDRSVCLALRPHQAACALTHRWTMAVRPLRVGEAERGLGAFRFASIVADPLTGLLSAPTVCELPFELITSLHFNDYSAVTDPDHRGGDIDDIVRTGRLQSAINASHSAFAIALRAAGLAGASWVVRGEEVSIRVDYGVDYLPVPGRCPGPVVMHGRSRDQWLITYDHSGGPRAERIAANDPRLSVNQCME